VEQAMLMKSKKRKRFTEIISIQGSEVDTLSFTLGSRIKGLPVFADWQPN
jgi:hypothetical protein